MRIRRALTLVEVLAATVLLAMLAAACMPMLQRAMRALGAPPPPDAPFELFELARLADSFLADPSTFSAKSPSEHDELQLPWPEHPQRPLVTVRRLRAQDAEVDHTWLAFSSGKTFIFRWVPVHHDTEEPVP
ncbi:MAG: prepilin-type N-terminal cleavage/methylation domain-containing protein [Planctomycetes bacterium]|nr:prepilin-type N-terminal cleavage/methylation domain-containing protein [Planctomycetota bacterium]